MKMNAQMSSILQELETENSTTRRVIERVPGDKLTWKPHEKSMSIGKLARHVANLPRGIIELSKNDVFDVSKAEFKFPEAESLDQIIGEFDEFTSSSLKELGSWDDKRANAPWKLMHGENEIAIMPRIALIRSLLLNHTYHHRGQMTVYLRLLNISVPSVYGPTADESPFGEEV